MQSRLIRLIGVVFSNGAMLSVLDKYDSVNERSQEISKLMKLHIQGVWQNDHKFIRQLPHCTSQNFDCGNIIYSSRRLWPTAFCNAFDQTGCSQLLQKVVQCLSFPVITEKYLSVFRKKIFYVPQIFTQNFIFVCIQYQEVTLTSKIL